MSNNRLTLPLEAKIDGQGNTYYIAKLKGPFTINCNEGIAILAFISDAGNEELQISSISPPKHRPQGNNDNASNS